MSVDRHNRAFRRDGSSRRNAHQDTNPETHSASGHKAPEGSIELREQRRCLEKLARRFLREALNSVDDTYSARMFLYARAFMLIATGLRLWEKTDKNFPHT